MRDAQGAVEEVGAHVNPVNTTESGPSSRQEAILYSPNWNRIQTVTFDVALTFDKTDVKKGHLGVANIFKAEVEGGVDTHNQRVNRVSFAVPILLPGHIVPKARASIRSLTTTPHTAPASIASTRSTATSSVDGRGGPTRHHGRSWRHNGSYTNLEGS